MERLKHWQLFGLVSLPIFISWHLTDQLYKDLSSVISLLIVILHFFAVGSFLENLRNQTHSHFFRFNIIYLIVYLLFAGTASLNIVELDSYIFLIFPMYCLLALIQVMDHIAILLRLCEGKDASDYKQVKEFGQLFFWPVGIWFFQPRINRLG